MVNWKMAGLGKVDMGCIGFMTAIILIIAGYMALFGGFSESDGAFIWIGWVWWVVIAISIASLIIIIFTSREHKG
jgi:hypothetical protein